jgi:hypothetical protein
MDTNTKEMMMRLGGELAHIGLKRLVARIREPKESGPMISYSGRDIAVVFSVTRPIKTDVEQFLFKNRIMAEVIEIKSKGRLSQDEKEWVEIVREFNEVIMKIQEELGTVTYHLFIAAPTALAFALGSILGLNYDIHVYHRFEEISDYREVLVTSRELLGC